MMFPSEFERAVRAELGDDAAAKLLTALDGEPVTSVRFNPFKLAAMPSVGTVGTVGTAGTDGADGVPTEDGVPTADGVSAMKQAAQNASGLVSGYVPWNRYGAYLAQRPVFTLDPAMHAGAYYVQEASSQFVEHLLREATGMANSGEDEADSESRADGGDGMSVRGLRILDLCAAPGGKTTLYSTLAGAEGLVVANEVIKQRASVLADNVRRWGIGNVAVCCNEPKDFAAYKHRFDVLAVDAPCSGEGMFRRVRESRGEWSPSAVEMCAARQRRILADAWDALRPGGVLIYSTCTFNRLENEENVAWLAENFAVERVEVEVPDEWGVVKGEVVGGSGGSGVSAGSGGIETFRFWPHLAEGEGFFAAVMRKADERVKRETPRARRQPVTELSRAESRPLTEWVAHPEAMKFARIGDNNYAFYRPVYHDVVALAEGLNVIYSGVCLGQLFGGKLRPDHALALFCDLRREKVAGTTDGQAEATMAVEQVAGARAACVELSREEALDYFRKREFDDLSHLAEGLNLLTFEGLPIGWTKRVGHRTNTMLPNSFRIVNL